MTANKRRKEIENSRNIYIYYFNDIVRLIVRAYLAKKRPM